MLGELANFPTLKMLFINCLSEVLPNKSLEVFPCFTGSAEDDEPGEELFK